MKIFSIKLLELNAFILRKAQVTSHFFTDFTCYKTIHLNEIITTTATRNIIYRLMKCVRVV